MRSMETDDLCLPAAWHHPFGGLRKKTPSTGLTHLIHLRRDTAEAMMRGTDAASAALCRYAEFEVRIRCARSGACFHIRGG